MRGWISGTGSAGSFLEHTQHGSAAQLHLARTRPTWTEMKGVQFSGTSDLQKIADRRLVLEWAAPAGLRGGSVARMIRL